MTKQTVARTTESGAGEVRYRPLYARALGLRHLHPGGMLCFVYLEGALALSVLLALAELVSWWVVLLLPVSVALMVKVNDLVAGAVARSAARTPERERARLRREVSAFMPMVGRAAVAGPAQLDEPTAPHPILAAPGADPRPTTSEDAVTAENAAIGADALGSDRPSGAVGSGQDGVATSGDQRADTAAAGRRDTTGRYTAAGRHLDEAWRQHAYAMAHQADHADQTSQHERQSAARRYE